MDVPPLLPSKCRLCLPQKIKDLEIVKGMSLEVSSGEVVGLLGPNGAGKTTTFYMICGLVEASGEKFFLMVKISLICHFIKEL